MSRRPRVISLAFVTCILGLAGRAWADGADVTATVLFDEGRKLMAAHDYAGACPKFAESQRLAPSGGTLINLAECYERAGQTASAWGTWKDVAARANAAGKADVEQKAVARATALEPTLARLIVTVASASDVPGLTVKRDGVILGHAEFGLAIPVDPGDHVVVAAAPGKRDFSAHVEVAAKQSDARITVSLPNEEAPGPTAGSAAANPASGAPLPPPRLESATSPSNGSTQRALGWVGIGVGAAGLAVGSLFGLTAISDSNQAKSDGCAGKVCTGSPAGVTETNNAIKAANASTVAFVVGGVLAAAGLVVVLTAPSAGGVHAAPAVGQGYAGLSVGGAL